MNTIKSCMTCRESTNQMMTQEHDGDEPTGPIFLTCSICECVRILDLTELPTEEEQ